MNKLVVLGKFKTIERGVILGELPARKIKDLRLTVGNHAHLRSGTILYKGSKIGERFETGHNVIIREENKIGDCVSIWSNSIIDYGCAIGKGAKIHCNCYIAQYTVIEEDVFLAPGVTIANDLHPGSPNAKNCMKGPTIKRGAQIGCNVTLLPHITIGEYALIGAGSVVTKDIPPYSVAYGNPARVKKKTSKLHCSIQNHFPYQTFYPKEI